MFQLAPCLPRLISGLLPGMLIRSDRFGLGGREESADLTPGLLDSSIVNLSSGSLRAGS